jgi:hypothetical protein
MHRAKYHQPSHSAGADRIKVSTDRGSPPYAHHHFSYGRNEEIKLMKQKNEIEENQAVSPETLPFRGPIERHHCSIRVRIDVQREGSDYWARVVIDPIRPELMPLASGPTREMAIHAAGEKASIPHDHIARWNPLPNDPSDSTLTELLESRHETLLQWSEPWPACGPEGNELDAHVVLRASIHDCINLNRRAAKAAGRPTMGDDGTHLLDFMASHWTRFVGDRRDGDAYVVRCPECKREKWIAASLFR